MDGGNKAGSVEGPASSTVAAWTPVGQPRYDVGFPRRNSGSSWTSGDDAAPDRMSVRRSHRGFPLSLLIGTLILLPEMAFNPHVACILFDACKIYSQLLMAWTSFFVAMASKSNCVHELYKIVKRSIYVGSVYHYLQGYRDATEERRV